jgi:hypothetical protein
MLLRGVVVAVYVYDAEQVFLNLPDVQINDIYVDVLLYGRNNVVLPRVQWSSPRSGLHEGDIVIPRAATLDTQSELNVQRSKPQAIDGDHVIVGFLEDDLTQPIVLGCIQHPSSDIGKTPEDPLGQRMRIRSGDGNPRLWKHRGTAFGVDQDGNWKLDTRIAHSGVYEDDGSEPAPTEDGSNGNTVIDLQEGSTLTVRTGNGATLLLTEKDGDATLTVGDGAVSVAVADHLEALYGQLKAAFDAHTHTVPIVGPTGTTASTAPLMPAPGWDSNINSDKVTIPDT